VLLRVGIARLLEEAGFEVVGQAGTVEDLLLKVRSYNPDVAIVDVRMAPTHTDEGLHAAREIAASYPATAVVVLAQYVEREPELAALAAVVDSACAGEGSLVVIEGTAGIGKTRLLAEARARAGGEMRVLSARGGELEGEFAFGVVRQLFEPLLATASAEV